MDQHGLRQSDLPEIGNQSVISQILSGARKLDLRQVKAISKRFGISPNVLIEQPIKKSAISISVASKQKVKV